MTGPLGGFNLLITPLDSPEDRIVRVPVLKKRGFGHIDQEFVSRLMAHPISIPAHQVHYV